MTENLKVEIVVGDEIISKRNAVFHTLHNILRKRRTASLRERPHKGKTNACIAAAKESSHFFKDGNYTRFKDWRFVHRARLGLFSLNGYRRPIRKKPGPVNKQCRRCKETETRPHVLDHCWVHITLYKKRHNAIIKRLKKAIASKWVILVEDRVVGNQNLRLDLVIQNFNQIYIVDVTVPFDNGLKAFDDARLGKMNKYDELAFYGKSINGKTATIGAVVVGALDSWDPANDEFIKKICSKSYGKMMKKIMVSETITYSRDIYSEHIGWIPQGSRGRQV